MTTPARRVHTGDRVADAAQRNGVDAVNRANAAVFKDGVERTEESGKPARSGLQFVSGTARTIAHGLGRKAIGFFEMYGPDLPSAAHVGLRPVAFPSGYSSATHISVVPAATGTCFVFVY